MTLHYFGIICARTGIVVLLASAYLVGADENHLDLTSRFSCGCLDSDGNFRPFDVSVVSSVQKTLSGWRYTYVVHNNKEKEIRLLIYFAQKGKVEFLTASMEAPSRNIDYFYGRGPIIIEGGYVLDSG